MPVRGAAILVPAMLGLVACAPATPPIPVADAQNLCLHLALNQPDRDPRVRVGVGLGTGGWHGGYGSIGVSTDAFARRDPAQAYHDCVVQRSGRAPAVSFYELLRQAQK